MITNIFLVTFGFTCMWIVCKYELTKCTIGKSCDCKECRKKRRAKL